MRVERHPTEEAEHQADHCRTDRHSDGMLPSGRGHRLPPTARRCLRRLLRRMDLHRVGLACRISIGKILGPFIIAHQRHPIVVVLA
jgi:hypothetical protein